MDCRRSAASSIRRGSMTMSFAPRSAACLMRAPTIGWFSVALAPQTRKRAREFDVVEGVGRRAGAEHRLHRRGGRRVADARAAIDVVGAEHDARELLREVVLLVRGARRAEHADAVGTVLRRRCAASFSAAKRERLGPRHVLPLAVLANHRLGDAVGDAREVERVPAFDAQVAFVHRRIEHGLHLHDAVVARADVHLAARAAIRDRSSASTSRRRRSESTVLIFERAGRAGVDARAAARRTSCRASVGPSGTMRVSAPRSTHVPDELPCTSSQMRTQRKQVMHCDMSTWM